MIEKWDGKLNSKYSPVFKLWFYYFKKFTFSWVAATELGKDIARYRSLTNSYWVNQLELWKVATSYGECDSHEYDAIRD